MEFRARHFKKFGSSNKYLMVFNFLSTVTVLIGSAKCEFKIKSKQLIDWSFRVLRKWFSCKTTEEVWPQLGHATDKDIERVFTNTLVSASVYVIYFWKDTILGAQIGTINAMPTRKVWIEQSRLRFKMHTRLFSRRPRSIFVSSSFRLDSQMPSLFHCYTGLQKP